MAYTKESFAILVTCLTQWWAPTVVRVSGDSSMVGQMTKKKDGSLQCDFAERMILMANHQLYTDWLYLWWIAYTNSMHGFIYIILKESLRNIPIIGWSAQFYNFIFLARNWEEDQRTFKKHLGKLNRLKDPMWLIIFPEGTNLSATTREKSKKWAEKNGLQDMKHQLLPRSTGLRFCLNELKDTTEWLYDCTIAYEGVPPGQFGQDIFTLRSTFFEGRPPKSVNMHWRRFHISTIPIQNTAAFDVWLRNRWREKDYMLEYFNRNTRFPAEDFWKNHLDMSSQSSQGGKSIRSVPHPAVQIETEVKSGNWNEFVKIFAPITSVMMALTVAYGASPEDLPIPGGREFFEQHIKTLLGQGGDMNGLPSPEELEKMIEGAAKMGAAQAAEPQHLTEVQKLTQENLAKLVRETAIRNGVVAPGGGRRASTARLAKTVVRPAMQREVESVVNAPAAARKQTAQGVKKPVARTVGKPAPTPAAKRKPTPLALTGPMKEITLASGVTIKVPSTSPAVSDAKKTGMVVLKNGMRVKIEKDEIEEAQKKDGETVMTASGVPIKITPGGGVTIANKAVGKSVVGEKKPVPPKINVQKSAPAPAKVNGTASSVQKKPAAPTKTTVAPPVKGKSTATAPRKL